MNILFIAYYFPPSNAAGAVRANCLAKYLAKNGDTVSVLTLPPQLYGASSDWLSRHSASLGINHIEVPPFCPSVDPHLKKSSSKFRTIFSRGLRRILRNLGKEPESLWYWNAQGKIKSLSQNFDIVIATGNPWVSFSLGEFASRTFGIPLVLDYRDLWTDNPLTQKSSTKTIAQEDKLLASATGVSVVSEPMLEKLSPRLANDTFRCVCENGFDPDELSDISCEQNRKFTILYAGTLYPPKRTLTPVFESLKNLLGRANLPHPWEFLYVGSWSQHVEKQIAEYDLQSNAKVINYLPRNEALTELARSDLSIVITSVLETGDAGDRSVLTSKIFDAIGLKKRILLISPDNSEAENVLARSGDGQRFHGNQISEMTDFFENCIRERGRVTLKSNKDCSWPDKIEGFRSFLKECIAKHSL